MIATERKSTLAIKKEITAITGSATSVTTAVTAGSGQFTSELVVGDVIGNSTKGWRTVTAIASASALTVDSAFISALSSDSLSKQTNETAATFTGADIIEFVPPMTLEATRAEIARAVVNRSFDELPPVLAHETVGGDIQIEARCNGTAGTESDASVLWEAGIGEIDKSTASATISGCTSTGINISSAAAGYFKVGHHIILDPTAGATGAYEVTRITAINTTGANTTLSISPSLSANAPSGRTIAAGVHYKTTITELHSLQAQFYRGDLIKEVYKGLKVASLAVDIQTGQAVNPKFTMKGTSTAVPVAAACALGTNSNADSGDVHIGRYAVVTIAGVDTGVSSVNFTLANDLYERMDVTSAGIKQLIRTKRTITGQFDVLYENETYGAMYRNGTNFELMAVTSKGDSALTVGNTMVHSFPLCRITKCSISADNGLYKASIQFKATRNVGEDSYYMSQL